MFPGRRRGSESRAVSTWLGRMRHVGGCGGRGNDGRNRGGGTGPQSDGEDDGDDHGDRSGDKQLAERWARRRQVRQVDGGVAEVQGSARTRNGEGDEFGGFGFRLRRRRTGNDAVDDVVEAAERLIEFRGRLEDARSADGDGDDFEQLGCGQRSAFAGEDGEDEGARLIAKRARLLELFEQGEDVGGEPEVEVVIGEEFVQLFDVRGEPVGRLGSGEGAHNDWLDAIWWLWTTGTQRTAARGGGSVEFAEPGTQTLLNFFPIFRIQPAMGALPIPEPYPHAIYIEELHQFLTSRGLPFGSPSDLWPMVERLDDPGLFHEDLRSLVRSFLVRENGNISRSDLLAILAVATGGPLVYRSAQQLRQPLSRLLAFLDGAMRKLPPHPSDAPAPRPRADVLQFPESEASAAQAAPRYSRPRVWSAGRSALQSLRPATSPSFRRTMLVALGALLLLAVLALLLRPSHPAVRTAAAPGGSYSVQAPARAAGWLGSLNSFLHSQEPSSMKRTPVMIAPAATISPGNPLNATAAGEAGTLGGVPQPASVRGPQRATAPSPASLRLAPEFSQPAPQGVVPPSSPDTPPPGVVPSSPQTSR